MSSRKCVQTASTELNCDEKLLIMVIGGNPGLSKRKLFGEQKKAAADGGLKRKRFECALDGLAEKGFVEGIAPERFWSRITLTEKGRRFIKGEAEQLHEIPVEALGHDRERVELKAPNTEDLKYWFRKAREGKASQLGQAAWLIIGKMCREQRILDYDKAPAFFQWALDQRGKIAVNAVYFLNVVASKVAELGEEEIVNRIRTHFGDRVVKLFREEFIHDLDARPGSIHLIELIFTPDKRLKLYESCLEALARTDSRKLEGLGRDLRPYFRELYREKEEGVRDWLSRLMERGIEGLSEEENDKVKDWALNYIETIT